MLSEDYAQQQSEEHQQWLEAQTMKRERDKQDDIATDTNKP